MEKYKSIYEKSNLFENDFQETKIVIKVYQNAIGVDFFKNGLIFANDMNILKDSYTLAKSIFPKDFTLDLRSGVWLFNLPLYLNLKRFKGKAPFKTPISNLYHSVAKSKRLGWTSVYNATSYDSYMYKEVASYDEALKEVKKFFELVNLKLPPRVNSYYSP